MEFLQEPQAEKVGSFDWIIDSDELINLLTSTLGSLSGFERICILGCGTSTLSEAIEKASGSVITSVDNDVNCLAHMTELHANNPRLRWIYCDLTETGGAAIEALQRCGPFDLLVDKGTFDAILVEGSACEMLANAYNLLKFDGILALCSLHGTDLLTPLFATPSLNLQASVLPIRALSLASGSVAVCRKRLEKANFVMNVETLRVEEAAIMDDYYKAQHPLLSDETESLIRRHFEARHSGGQTHVPVEELHALIFAPHEALGYTSELFLEDLCEYPLSLDGHMTLEELLAFLREKQ